MILHEQDAVVASCGISRGDTIFLVDENQPASWKRKSDMGEAVQTGIQDCPPLHEHSKAEKEENPLLNLIREVENQVCASQRKHA